MTPEELETIPGIGAETVEKILIAVNSYYAQFEPPAEAEPAVVEEVVPEELVAEETVSASENASADIETAALESESGLEASNGETPSPDSSNQKSESDTIKNSEDVG
jgi:hypothetical protein